MKRSDHLVAVVVTCQERELHVEAAGVYLHLMAATRGANSKSGQPRKMVATREDASVVAGVEHLTSGACAEVRGCHDR